MCISEMTVILMSLGVITANFKEAELFCGNRFGDSAVDIGFERGIVADNATGWMNGNVGQQRLYATEQRVSSARERPSVATRVAAAKEGPDEAMRQALAASSAKEASAVSNAKEVLAASSTIKGVCCERRGRGREEPDVWRETGVVDWVSNVTDIMRCDHDDDAGCKQSERSQVLELRGAMRETSAG